MLKNVYVTNVYRRTVKAKARTVINYGGSGSSKSYSMCQFFIFQRLLTRKKYKLLILRKTRISNKLSIYEDFINILKKYKLYDENCHNQTDLKYTFKNGNVVLFGGLDNKEKIKSTGWNDIWMEEASDFSKEDYIFLHTRKYRGTIVNKDEIPRIYMTFNPIDCWIFSLEGNKDVEFIHSTHLDNRFSNMEYRRTLESLKDLDETYYKIYALGLRGIPKNIIYEPYTMLNSFPSNFEETIYGIDFGYITSKSALLQVNYLGNEFYLRELVYQTGLLNNQFIELCKEKIPHEHKVRYFPLYADSAEPAYIQEFKNEGLNIIPAVKGPGSVKNGIDFCRRFRYYTLEENVNLNKENKAYKWRQDKDGNILQEPLKFMDHLKDAKRYAIYTHYKDRFGKDIKELLRRVKEDIDILPNRDFV